MEVVLRRRPRQLLPTSFNGCTENRTQLDAGFSETEEESKKVCVYLARQAPMKAEALWRTPEFFSVLVLTLRCTRGTPFSGAAFLFVSREKGKMEGSGVVWDSGSVRESYV